MMIQQITAKITIRQILVGLLWLSFTVYAWVFAPGDSPATIELIKKLSTMDVAGINPAIVDLFNLMGLLPLMYGCMLYVDGRNQKLPAWVFVTGSFFLGAFALLPYMALREDNPGFEGKPDWFLKIWESKITAVLIGVGAIGLLTLGVTQADWPDFWQQWHSSKFIHVMSLDFCMLSLVFPLLLWDDMARRGWCDRRVFWAVALVPLLGALVYLVMRPGLVVDGE